MLAVFAVTDCTTTCGHHLISNAACHLQEVKIDFCCCEEIVLSILTPNYAWSVLHTFFCIQQKLELLFIHKQKEIEICR